MGRSNTRSAGPNFIPIIVRAGRARAAVVLFSPDVIIAPLTTIGSDPVRTIMKTQFTMPKSFIPRVRNAARSAARSAMAPRGPMMETLEERIALTINWTECYVAGGSKILAAASPITKAPTMKLHDANA